jgi:hypothetical protein
MNGTQLLPFSYTRLADWERCPLYAYTVHVLKKRSPPNAAMARGTLIHERAQLLVTGTGKQSHTAETLRYLDEFHEASTRHHAKPGTVFAEEKFAVTSVWKMTEFFAENAWCRGVWDLAIMEPSALRVIDHKTGKMYDTHMDQLKLYAVTASVRWPAAPVVQAEAWYLDFPSDRKLVVKFDKRDIGKLRREFEARVLKMVKDTKMLPKANVYCGNCHLNKKNGGTCKAGD